MANPNPNTSGLQRGGNEKRIGAREKYGVAYRNAFTQKDMEELAAIQLQIARDETVKPTDRIKVISEILKKLVSDVIPEEDKTPINLEELQEVLANAGYELTSITK